MFYGLFLLISSILNKNNYKGADYMKCENDNKNKWKLFRGATVSLLVFAALAAMTIPSANLSAESHLTKTSVPYEGVVCMHGVDVGVADEDAEHICEHMAVLRSEDTYVPKFNFDEATRIDIEPERLEMIKGFIESIENCKEPTYIFELSANGIDDWQQFEENVRIYCADYYEVDDMITGRLGDLWHTEADGRSYIQLDVAHCKEVMELCRQEETRRLSVEASIQEVVARLGLNGYKVHDLKLIHDYVCENITYDWDLTHTTVYEFFTEDSVQCAGYTRAFKAICDYVGLDVEYVSGNVGTEMHAWNSVEIDGSTYYIDCTWDDTQEGQDISYEYFLTVEPNGTIDGETSEPAPTDTTESSESSITEETKPVTVDPVVTEPIVEQTTPVEPEPAKPSVVFTEVNETVYAVSSVNVRTGPGTEHSKIGQLQTNQSVTRVGIGDNGWSKVYYNGSEAYIASNYLTTEEPHIETVAEEMARRGNMGRLRISSVGVDVALFETSMYDISHSQPIVDNADSAAYISDTIDDYGFIIIGDHVHQGFAAIKSSVPGVTIAEIDSGTNIQTYICTEIFIGYNNGCLDDLNGNCIKGRNDGGICMYTCNSDGTITITFWQPA